MKRFLLAISVAVACGTFFVLMYMYTRVTLYSRSTPPQISPTPSTIHTVINPKQFFDITQDNRSFRIAWFTVQNPDTISLIPNFREQNTSRAALETSHCLDLVNGGFYTQEKKPTGLFVTHGETEEVFQPNTLLNGIFSITTQGQVSITSEPPKESLRIALQTGPVLFRNGYPQKLRLIEDEFARRSVVATTVTNAVLFFVLYDRENPYQGPLLSEVPFLLTQWQKQTTQEVRDAINLDGGSASAWYSEGFFLQELTAVGSYFCVLQ